MKVLFNKLKKSNKILLTICLISFIAYLVTFIFFTGSLLSLKGIETFLRIGFITLFALWIIIYFIWNLVNLILKRSKTIIITTIITILLSVVFGFGSYIINKVYNKLEKLTSSNTTVYTTYLISMKDNEIDEDSKLGMIKNKKDVEGHI